MRLHVGAQDGVDTGLVAALLPEPAQQVGVQTHRHNFLRRGHYHPGALPELFIRRDGLGVGRNPLADAGGAPAARGFQLVPLPRLWLDFFNPNALPPQNRFGAAYADSLYSRLSEVLRREASTLCNTGQDSLT